MNMKRDADDMLKTALAPNVMPGDEVNEKLLAAAKENSRARNVRNMFRTAKVAAAALAVVCMGSVGVYAASKLIDKVTVGNRTISGGNPEYYSDEEIDTSFANDKFETVSHEDGDDTVKWLTKDVEKVNDTVTNTRYGYSDYATAVEEAGLPNWFSAEYKSSGEAVYCITEDEDFEEKEVSAYLLYDDEKEFYVTESIMTGNVAEDSAYIIYLGNTKNQRTYTSPDGQEFTLVDSERGEGEFQYTATYVMIRYDGYDGYVSFDNWDDADIHKVLDSLAVK